ncbi:unnamed protein product, partial [Owenia fusiformis]
NSPEFYCEYLKLVFKESELEYKRQIILQNPYWMFTSSEREEISSVEDVEELREYDNDDYDDYDYYDGYDRGYDYPVMVDTERILSRLKPKITSLQSNIQSHSSEPSACEANTKPNYTHFLSQTSSLGSHFTELVPAVSHHYSNSAPITYQSSQTQAGLHHVIYQDLQAEHSFHVIYTKNKAGFLEHMVDLFKTQGIESEPIYRNTEFEEQCNSHQKCSKCGESNHVTSTCWCRKPVRCFRCNQLGHKRKLCPS